uniref:Orf121c n=1 Tax=Eruca vesicaria subsp. sativa TaxID=29727 RepID=A0A088BFZ5_ERUVS|nr:orf121c [Eruca vesicaria subsp. sativa]
MKLIVSKNDLSSLMKLIVSQNDLSSLMKLIVCERNAITRLFTYLISSNSSFYLSGCSTYPSLSNLVCYSIDLPLGWILGYLRSDQHPIPLQMVKQLSLTIHLFPLRASQPVLALAVLPLEL